MCEPENMGKTFWAKNEPPKKGELDANKFCSQLVVNDADRFPLESNWQSVNCDAPDGYTGWICTPEVRFACKLTFLQQSLIWLKHKLSFVNKTKTIQGCIWNLQWWRSWWRWK